MTMQPHLRHSTSAQHEFLWTVDRYHAAIRRGAFTEDDKIELIEGKLYQKMSINPSHATCLTLLVEFFYDNYRAQYAIRSENPITLPEASEPEPDLVLATPPTKRYAAKHPYPEDVFLVVEVADATLKKDQTVKLQTYAKAALPEYWILNLVDRQLEIYTQPRPDGTYAKAAMYAAGTQAESDLAGPIEVDRFLP